MLRVTQRWMLQTTWCRSGLIVVGCYDDKRSRDKGRVRRQVVELSSNRSKSMSEVLCRETSRFELMLRTTTQTVPETSRYSELHAWFHTTLTIGALRKQRPN